MEDVIKANHGFYVLVYNEVYEDSVALHPVIAWTFDGWTPRPITLQHGLIVSNVAIQQPNGIVTQVGNKDRLWESVKDWVDSKKTEQKA